MSRFIFRIAAALLVTLIVPAAMAADVQKHEKRVIVRDGKVFTSENGGDEVMVLPPAFLMRGAYLGIGLVELTPELRQHFGVAGDSGVLVSRVEKASPAEKAGVRVGDIITSIDGQKVASGWDIGRLVRAKKNGEQVKLDFVRNGARSQALASVAERERQQVDIGRIMIDEDLPNGERIVIDGMGPAMEKLEKYFDSPEWKAKVESMQDCSRVQIRVKDLERRLQDLEKKLNQK